MDPTTNNSLNAIVQGNGPTNRDGNRYIVTRCQVRGQVFLKATGNNADPPNSGTIFIALVQDKQTNSAKCRGMDVFSIPPEAQATALKIYAPFPFRNQQFLSRFNVLQTTTIDMNRIGGQPSAGGDYPEQGHSFEFDQRMNMNVQCDGVGGTVASISDNSLHVLAVTSVGNTQSDMLYNARLTFSG